MTHGHEVLEMMQGHSYSEKSLLEAIIAEFGQKSVSIPVRQTTLPLRDSLIF